MAKQIFIVTVFLIIVNVSYCYACSKAKGTLIDDPELVSWHLGKPLYQKNASKPTSYVFIGQVVGIVKATKAELGTHLTDAEGVRVKVTENIYSPREADYYEVFPLGTNTDCSLRGEVGIERAYPVGSQVRVIASEAAIYKKQSNSDSVIRLETTYWKDTSLVRNDLEKEFKVSANTIINYSDFIFKPPMTTEEENRYYLLKSYLEFELQKDLIRLTKAKSRTERLKILERLVYFPHFYMINYRILLHIYLKPGNTLESLEKKWQQRKKEALPKANKT